MNLTTLAKAKSLVLDAARKQGIKVSIVKAEWLSRQHGSAFVDVTVAGKPMGVAVTSFTNGTINVYFGVRHPNR